MNDQEYGSDCNTAIGKIKYRRKKADGNIVNYIAVQHTVNQISESTADNQRNSRVGKEIMLLIFEQGVNHDDGNRQSSHNEEPPLILQHSERRTPVLDIKDAEKPFDNGKVAVRLHI